MTDLAKERWIDEVEKRVSRKRKQILRKGRKAPMQSMVWWHDEYLNVMKWKNFKEVLDWYAEVQEDPYSSKDYRDRIIQVEYKNWKRISRLYLDIDDITETLEGLWFTILKP